MPNIPTEFYVTRGYIVKARNMLGDSVVLSSFCDDTEAGKAKCEKRAKELQKQNDDERKVKTKKGT